MNLSLLSVASTAIVVVLSSATTAVNAEPSPCPSECHHTLDFNEFSAGMYIHDQYKDEHGVLIWAKAKSSKGWTPDVTTIDMSGYSSTNPITKSNTNPSQFGTPTGTSAYGAPRVFDSNRPSGRSWQPQYHQPLCPNGEGDTDLGSPNENCSGGGPGKGPGNHNGDWWNCPSENIGNILIIQEENSNSVKYSGSEDWKYCPDDAGSGGGFIEFHFDSPADILHVEMLDTDESNTPDIHFYKPGGSRYTLDTPATGDNGLFHKDLAGIEYSGIDKVSFEYYGSGSVAGKFFAIRSKRTIWEQQQ